MEDYNHISSFKKKAEDRGPRRLVQFPGASVKSQQL